MKSILTTLFFSFVFILNLNAEVSIGKLAPNFNGTNVVNSKNISLNDFKGKTVVLEWHNPNCPFVVKHYSSNNMQSIQEKYTKKGVVWITINSGAKGKPGVYSNSEINKYLKKKKYSGSAYISDVSGEIGKAYGARTTPHMYIINKDGILAYQGAIDSNDSARVETIKGAKNYVSLALDELFQEKLVSVTETEPYGCSVKY